MEIEVNGEIKNIPNGQILANTDVEFEATYAKHEISIEYIDGGWSVKLYHVSGKKVMDGFLPHLFGTKHLYRIKDVIVHCLEKIL